jgi:hypothetical protein
MNDWDTDGNGIPDSLQLDAPVVPDPTPAVATSILVDPYPVDGLPGITLPPDRPAEPAPSMEDEARAAELERGRLNAETAAKINALPSPHDLLNKRMLANRPLDETDEYVRE